MDDAARSTLEVHLPSSEEATTGDLRDFARETLELFTTAVAIPPGGMARIVPSAVMRVQISALSRIDNPIDGAWREAVDAHVDTAGRFVDAVADRDLPRALALREGPDLVALFICVNRMCVTTKYGTQRP